MEFSSLCRFDFPPCLCVRNMSRRRIHEEHLIKQLAQDAAAC